MADTKEADPRRKEPAKKGLHGWKAAVAIFGSGTLAAFVTFGALVGVLSLLLNAASSGLSGANEPVPVADQSVKPREEFLDGKFDLCGRTLPSIRDLNLNFDPARGDYEDTSIDGGEPGGDDLVRSDECGGEISPMGSYIVPWDFEFSYRAIIFSPEDRDRLAADELANLRSEVDASGLVIEDSGEGNLGDESYYYYAPLAENAEATYIIFVRHRSATYSVRVSSTDDVSLQAFSGEVRKFDPQLRITLINRIPE